MAVNENPTFGLDLFRIGVMAEFRRLAEYLKVMEDQAQLTKQQKINTIEANFGLSAQEPSEVVALLRQITLEETERGHDITFARTLRYSLITLLFMQVETQLKVVCDQISERKKLELRLNDLAGRSLFERIRKFFSKVVHCPPLSDSLWEAIVDLQKVRDCIVHAGGVIADSRDCDHIRTLIEKQIGLSLSQSPEEEETLIVGRAFCDKTLEAVQKAFVEVFDRAECFGDDPCLRPVANRGGQHSETCNTQK